MLRHRLRSASRGVTAAACRSACACQVLLLLPQLRCRRLRCSCSSSSCGAAAAPPPHSLHLTRRFFVRVQNTDGTKTEYRVWNPFRSKIAASVLGGVENIYIGPGQKVLYLGAASGTSVSHVSDLVGPVRCLTLLPVDARLSLPLLQAAAGGCACPPRRRQRLFLWLQFHSLRVPLCFPPSLSFSLLLAIADWPGVRRRVLPPQRPRPD